MWQHVWLSKRICWWNTHCKVLGHWPTKKLHLLCWWSRRQEEDFWKTYIWMGRKMERSRHKEREKGGGRGKWNRKDKTKQKHKKTLQQPTKRSRTASCRMSNKCSLESQWISLAILWQIPILCIQVKCNHWLTSFTIAVSPRNRAHSLSSLPVATPAKPTLTLKTIPEQKTNTLEKLLTDT